MVWRKGNRLRLVPEPEAPERTRQIYQEFKQALGIPVVPTILQAYAAYPEFLEQHWEAVRPMLDTQEFFDLGERLRADAYTRCFNYFEIPDLRLPLQAGNLGEGARRELDAAIDLFLYANPLMLLLVSAQFLGFEAPVGQRAKAPTKPARHPIHVEIPHAPAENTLPTATRQILNELRRAIGLPLVTSDYRVLARRPELLAAYWKALKSALQSPIYEGCHHALRESAFALAREFPQPLDLSLARLAEFTVSEEDQASLVRITETFVESLSQQLLHVSMAKIGLEGGTRPQAREAPAAEREPPAGERKAPPGEREAPAGPTREPQPPTGGKERAA